MFGQLPDPPAAKPCLACIAQVLAAFAQQRPHWVAATSAIDWHLGRLHAIVLDQCARFEVERSSAFHDRALAENGEPMLEAEGPDAKAVLCRTKPAGARRLGQTAISMGK